MLYLDVLVVISPARGGDFEVNVASQAGGEGNSILKLPFPMSALSGLMYNVVGADRKFLAAGPSASLPQGTAASFGVQLFEALFQGETRDVLSRTEAAAKLQPGTGTRIRLSMNLAADGIAEVASLPWELMCRRDQPPLVVSVQTPVVRAFDTPRPTLLQPLSGKLRILALVSNPSGTEVLDLQDEVARISKIWATLDNIEVDFVRPVEDDVLNHLAAADYHVIHYMGHGDFDPGTGGVLVMEGADGSARPITGATFAAWLQDEPLRLVFLNACNTGTTGERIGLHPFSGVASALIRNGVPAVVAMQFPISDDAAILFAQTFYARIAQGFPVDAAVGDARKRLLTGDGAEWATPVLYMRAADGNLFSEAKPGQTPRKRATATPAVAPAVSGSRQGSPAVSAEARRVAAAIAAIPAASWINDPDEQNTARTVLAKVTLAQLQAVADAGDAKAAYLTGSAYWYGLGGTAASPARAVPFYARAAKLGLAVGQFAMAYCYDAGVDAEPDGERGTIPGLVVNYAKSGALLQKAKAQGNRGGA